MLTMMVAIELIAEDVVVLIMVSMRYAFYNESGFIGSNKQKALLYSRQSEQECSVFWMTFNRSFYSFSFHHRHTSKAEIVCICGFSFIF